jgi:hypothetical protein
MEAGSEGGWREEGNDTPPIFSQGAFPEGLSTSSELSTQGNLEGNQEHSDLIRSDNRLGHSLQLTGH